MEEEINKIEETTNKLFIKKYHLVELGITFGLGIIFGVLFGVFMLLKFMQ